MRAILLTISVACVAVLLACKGGTEETTTTSSSRGPIGITECDDYLNKYEKCVSENAPAASKNQLTTNVSAMRASWKRAAANPATHAGLVQGCKQALTTARTALASYGCAW